MTKCRVLDVVLVVIAAAMISTAALAQTPAPGCTKPDIALVPRIAACTDAIYSQKYSGSGLSMIYIARGNAYLAIARERPDGNYNYKAVQDFTQAVSLDPRNIVALVGLGVAYSRSGDHDRAIIYETNVIRIDPQNAVALGGRCWDRASGGNPAVALGDCDEALRLQPGDAKFLNSRALAELKTGRYQKALADYNAALAQNAEDADSLYGRGVTKLKGGDTAGGNADIATAKKIQPEIAKEFQWDGFWVHWSPLKSPIPVPVARTPEQWKCTGKPDIPWDQQERGCSDALVSGLYVGEDDAWAFDNRGTASYGKGDISGAFHDYSAAIYSDPNYALAYYHRGNAYYRINDFASAVADYSAAIALNATDAASRYGRGMAKLNSKDTAGGNADIAAAKAIDPHIAEVWRAFVGLAGRTP